VPTDRYFPAKEVFDDQQIALAVQFAGIPMKTPVMGASGTFGFGVEYSDFLDLDHVGAIISKGITPLPRPGNPGVRVAETRQGCSTASAWKIPASKSSSGISCPRSEACQTPLIVNISAGTAEEYGELAAQLDVDGVAALEVNISCPNVKEGGIVFGTDPRAALRP
jgi:dihydroorotate dehydrogenase (NAD+) catalytic subunit